MPKLIATALAALLSAAAACGDNLTDLPAVCDVPEAERTPACEALCKTGDDTNETCPGPDDVRACVAECVACAPDVAWCPAGE